MREWQTFLIQSPCKQNDKVFISLPISYTTVLRHITILEVINKGFSLPFSFTFIWCDEHVISGHWMTPRHSLSRIFI